MNHNRIKINGITVTVTQTDVSHHKRNQNNSDEMNHKRITMTGITIN